MHKYEDVSWIPFFFGVMDTSNLYLWSRHRKFAEVWTAYLDKFVRSRVRKRPCLKNNMESDWGRCFTNHWLLQASVYVHVWSNTYADADFKTQRSSSDVRLVTSVLKIWGKKISLSSRLKNSVPGWVT